MPGNETVAKGKRVLLPTIWTSNNFIANQLVALPMAIAGFPASIVEVSLPRKSSLLTLVILLSEPVTAGKVTFEVTKNGVLTGKSIGVGSSTGTRKMLSLEPGDLVFAKSAEIGIAWTTNAAFLPSGVIDAVILCEMQDA